MKDAAAKTSTIEYLENNPYLKLSNLTFALSTREISKEAVVSDIEKAITGKSAIVISGRLGCGKSTLIRSINLHSTLLGKKSFTYNENISLYANRMYANEYPYDFALLEIHDENPIDVLTDIFGEDYANNILYINMGFDKQDNRRIESLKWDIISC